MDASNLPPFERISDEAVHNVSLFLDVFSLSSFCCVSKNVERVVHGRAASVNTTCRLFADDPPISIAQLVSLHMVQPHTNGITHFLYDSYPYLPGGSVARFLCEPGDRDLESKRARSFKLIASYVAHFDFAHDSPVEALRKVLRRTRLPPSTGVTQAFLRRLARRYLECKRASGHVQGRVAFGQHTAPGHAASTRSVSSPGAAAGGSHGFGTGSVADVPTMTFTTTHRMTVPARRMGHGPGADEGAGGAGAAAGPDGPRPRQSSDLSISSPGSPGLGAAAASSSSSFLAQEQHGHQHDRSNDSDDDDSDGNSSTADTPAAGQTDMAELSGSTAAAGCQAAPAPWSTAHVPAAPWASANTAAGTETSPPSPASPCPDPYEQEGPGRSFRSLAAVSLLSAAGSANSSISVAHAGGADHDTGSSATGPVDWAPLRSSRMAGSKDRSIGKPSATDGLGDRADPSSGSASGGAGAAAGGQSQAQAPTQQVLVDYQYTVNPGHLAWARRQGQRLSLFPSGLSSTGPASTSPVSPSAGHSSTAAAGLASEQYAPTTVYHGLDVTSLDEESLYVLFYSLIIVNTDMRSPSIPLRHKIGPEDWAVKVKAAPELRNIPDAFWHGSYAEIAAEGFKVSDGVYTGPARHFTVVGVVLESAGHAVSAAGQAVQAAGHIAESMMSQAGEALRDAGISSMASTTSLAGLARSVGSQAQAALGAVQSQVTTAAAGLGLGTVLGGASSEPGTAPGSEAGATGTAVEAGDDGQPPATSTGQAPDYPRGHTSHGGAAAAGAATVQGLQHMTTAAVEQLTGQLSSLQVGIAAKAPSVLPALSSALGSANSGWAPSLGRLWGQAPAPAGDGGGHTGPAGPGQQS